MPFVFFFQAEDGIRDHCVTGVQTCALPIFFLYATYPPISIALIFVVIASIGAGPLNPIIGAVEYERVPKNMRGRVGGAIGAGAWSAMPLGMLIGGVLTEQLGVRSMLIGLGVIYFITNLRMAFMPAMKEMNRKIAVTE